MDVHLALFVPIREQISFEAGVLIVRKRRLTKVLLKQHSPHNSSTTQQPSVLQHSRLTKHYSSN
jgi:hypothetical protein